MKHPTQDQLLNAAIILDGAHPEVAAMLVRMAEQPAQQQEPNSILVEGFWRVAMRKLNDLHEQGYAINGVSIERTNDDGTVERGAVTTGGMVLWWPAEAEQARMAEQPAQQGPVATASAWFALIVNAAAELEDASHCMRDEDAKRVAIRGAKYYRDAANALYTSPPPRKPWVGLTDEQKDAARYRWLKARLMGADFDWNESGACALVFEWPKDVPVGVDCDQNIDAAIEAAHGITAPAISASQLDSAHAVIDQQAARALSEKGGAA